MKKNYYRQLQRYLTTGFFILVIIPIIFISIVTIYNLKKCAVKNIEILETQLAGHHRDIITNYLDQKINMLSTFSGMYSVKTMSSQEHLERLYKSINRTSHIVDLQIIDSSGDQRSYVGPYKSKFQGKNYHDATWFQDVLVSGKHISDVFMGVRNVPHIVVVVTDPLKSYVLRATINSEAFNSLLFGAQVGPGGDAYIINRKGQFQTPSIQGIKELPETEREFLTFHEGIVVTTRDNYLYTTQWIKDGQWLIMLKSKISDSLSRYKINRNNNLIFIAVISVIILVCSIFLSRYMVNKMKKIDRQRADLDHQMVQVEKMATVGRLAAGIAHEINNPLQMITSQSGWIQELLPEEDPEKVKNLEDYQEAIKRIRHHVKRAGVITQRLLGFSRKISAEKEFVNINELLEETVSFVENEATNNSITIEKTLAQDLPTTMTDGAQLQQVFLNVLNNGLDAVEPGGHLYISTKARRRSIIVEFSDTGHGISPEVMRQIFDPFFTTKDPGKGTGLGMYICYDIMKKLGGKIDVKNGKNGGAVFTLVVPIRKLGESGEEDNTELLARTL